VPEGATVLRRVLRSAPGKLYRSRMFHRTIKSALAVAMLALLGWEPASRILETSSVEAVVNAQLITLRSPIDGEISFEKAMSAGNMALVAGTQLVHVSNRRADRSRLDDLNRELRRRKEAQSITSGRLAVLQQQLTYTVAQVDLFQNARVRQLEARLDEMAHEEAGAAARHEQAEAALQRSTTLFAQGLRAPAAHDQARREAATSAADRARVHKRMEAAQIELQALRRGSFVGDSYNDRPRSTERVDELRLQFASLSADLEAAGHAIADLTEDMRFESARYEDKAGAVITAPSSSQIWEVLTAPGEQVRQGQEILRLLDCSRAAASATVSETAFNSLKIGTPVRFQFKDGGDQLAGTVIHLAGQATVAANLAIAPASLRRESYRVTASLPALAASGNCQPGRTGRIIFNSSGRVSGLPSP
jgi:biotin carboxyl carrier protein